MSKDKKYGPNQVRADMLKVIDPITEAKMGNVNYNPDKVDFRDTSLLKYGEAVKLSIEVRDKRIKKLEAALNTILKEKMGCPDSAADMVIRMKNTAQTALKK